MKRTLDRCLSCMWLCRRAEQIDNSAQNNVIPDFRGTR
jgi:hypothetical protein